MQPCGAASGELLAGRMIYLECDPRGPGHEVEMDEVERLALGQAQGIRVSLAGLLLLRTAAVH